MYMNILWSLNAASLSLSKQLLKCYVKIQRSRIIGGTQIITNKRKTHLFDKIIHFSMHFSAVLNIFIVKTKLNTTFTNDLKRK